LETFKEIFIFPTKIEKMEKTFGQEDGVLFKVLYYPAIENQVC
jgi:hypothetical protein